MSVVAGFYRTCVIDGVLEHSPAKYVRRPNVPSESPALGLALQQRLQPFTENGVRVCRTALFRHSARGSGSV